MRNKLRYEGSRIQGGKDRGKERTGVEQKKETEAWNKKGKEVVWTKILN